MLHQRLSMDGIAAVIYELADNGVPYFRFESIPADRVAHGVFTRHGGVSPTPWSSLNFSITVGDTPENVAQNRVLAHEALALDPARLMDRYIAHTAITWHVDERHLGLTAPHADGVVTRAPNLSLMMTFADCQPLLAYDPARHILGVAHAGWRGTLDGMALSLVRAMEAEGSRPGDLLVGLGPAIGACCYEVGEEVAVQALTWPRGGEWLRPGQNSRPHLDLSAANEAILRAVGVQHIERADLCTACRTDLFFSHRAERRTGRFALVASLV
jgi:polyphenol oxidase